MCMLFIIFANRRMYVDAIIMKGSIFWGPKCITGQKDDVREEVDMYIKQFWIDLDRFDWQC